MRDELDDVYPGHWRPFCEIGSAIGGIIGGIGSIIGGSQAAGAAKDASQAQVEAARIAAGVQREALDFQKETFDVSRADLDPYRATGGAALHTMSDMFIPGGQSVVQMQSRLNDLRARRAVLARQENEGTGPAQAGEDQTGGGSTDLTTIARALANPVSLYRDPGIDHNERRALQRNNPAIWAWTNN